MPGLLNEAEIAALGAARERALAELRGLPEFGFGPASAERIAAWDIDIGPDGEGLPPGRGSVERGETLYRLQCVQCHGARGEGAQFEALAGPGSRGRLPLRRGPALADHGGQLLAVRHHAVRLHPAGDAAGGAGTLPADDVYALTAFVLSLNGLVSPADSLDAETLPRIVMPARDRFVRDDRRGGPEVR